MTAWLQYGWKDARMCRDGQVTQVVFFAYFVINYSRAIYPAYCQSAYCGLDLKRNLSSAVHRNRNTFPSTSQICSTCLKALQSWVLQHVYGRHDNRGNNHQENTGRYSRRKVHPPLPRETCCHPCVKGLLSHQLLEVCGG